MIYLKPTVCPETQEQQNPRFVHFPRRQLNVNVNQSVSIFRVVVLRRIRMEMIAVITIIIMTSRMMILIMNYGTPSDIISLYTKLFINGSVLLL